MKRLLTAAAILGLVAFMLPATAGIALGAPPPPYCINIVKTDQNNIGLGGAEFTITQQNTDFRGWQMGTDGSGIASFCELPASGANGYVITESGPPLGYSGAASQSVVLPADTDNGSATLKFVDKLLPPTVKITLHKVVESGSAPASAFGIMLWPMPSDVQFYHDGDFVMVVPGSYSLNENPPPDTVYYEKSVICTSDGASQGRNFSQPYPRAGGPNNGLNLLVGLDPAEVWVCTITNTDAPTEPAPITGWKVSTADCTTVDGRGSITVTGFTDPADKQQVAVTPGDLVITKDGTYPLDPGTYNWSYGDRIGGGGPGNDFTIGPCPSPSESPSASPSPSPSASPVASPTPKPAVTPTPKPTSTTLPAAITLPQTGTIGASTGGSSSPLVPISIALLLVAATGLMLTRRPKSR